MRRGEKRRTWRKTSRSRGKNQKTNLTHSWLEPGPRRWEARAITTRHPCSLLSLGNLSTYSIPLIIPSKNTNEGQSGKDTSSRSINRKQNKAYAQCNWQYGNWRFLKWPRNNGWLKCGFWRLHFADSGNDVNFKLFP